MTQLQEAKKIIVSLGKTTKMPCPSYNTPASKCNVGGVLRQIKGSVCNGCYAFKGNYVYNSVQQGLLKRFHAFKHPRYVEAMSYMINRYCTTHFRWFDSGDLYDMKMLEKIVMVCQQTPKIKHWLPTRETTIIKDYLKIYKEFPKNMVVIISSPLIDGKPLKSFRWTSTVHHYKEPIGHDCPSRFQDNKCQSCRACWDKRRKNISYHKH